MSLVPLLFRILVIQNPNFFFSVLCISTVLFVYTAVFHDHYLTTLATFDLRIVALEDNIMDHDWTWHVKIAFFVVFEATAVVCYISCVSDSLASDIYYIVGMGCGYEEKKDDFCGYFHWKLCRFNVNSLIYLRASIKSMTHSLDVYCCSTQVICPTVFYPSVA